MDESLDRELAQQATALRRLASALVRDASVADDVAQQTLQRAITHGGPTMPSGGWLYRTLVNFTHQWRRREHRRTRHESAAATPPPIAAPLQILQRRETLKNVTDAVLSLDEPYQTAILLRYFEDLPPRVIAKRTNCNLTTVKSRLQRGLVMLRQRLDRCQDRDDWRLGLAVAFGLPSAAAVAVSVSTGVMLMSTATKTLAAALLLGVGGYLLFGAHQEPPAQSQATASVGEPAPAVAQTPPTTTTKLPAAEDRTSVIPPPIAAPWLEHPYSVELEVRIVDDTGLPVAGRQLRIAPIGCALDDSAARTDDDGRVIVQWPTRRPQVEVDVQLPNGALRRVRLENGRRTSIVVVALPDRATGNTSIEVPLLSGLPMLGQFFVNGSKNATAMQAGLHPFTLFADPCALPVVTAKPQDEQARLADEQTRLAGLSFAINSLGVGRQPTTLQLVTTLSYVRDFDAQVASEHPGSITGTVLGDDGQPAAGVPVALLGNSPQPVARKISDASGGFQFADLTAGEFTVRAGGHEQGLNTSRVVVTTGNTPTTVLLQRGATVRGHVLTTGDDKHTFTIEWRADDDSWADAAVCATDGSFVFANLPRTHGSLLVWEHDSDSRLPVAFVADVPCDGGDLQVRVDQKQSGTLRLDPHFAADLDIHPSIEVRVHQCETGLTAALTAPKEGSLGVLADLPAGYYDAEVFANGCGRIDLTRLWIDGTTVDLGVVELPRPGRLDFELPADVHAQQCELFRINADFDVRESLGDASLLTSRYLPAGDYGLALRDDRGAIHFTRCVVRAGERTIVRTLD